MALREEPASTMLASRLVRGWGHRESLSSCWVSPTREGRDGRSCQFCPKHLSLSLVESARATGLKWLGESREMGMAGGGTPAQTPGRWGKGWGMGGHGRGASLSPQVQGWLFHDHIRGRVGASWQLCPPATLHSAMKALCGGREER